MTGPQPLMSLAVWQARIYQQLRSAARPYQHLMPWVVDRANLEAAWRHVASNEGSRTPGVDGLTCDDLAGRESSWLARLADDLVHGRFRPRPPRWVDVPKGDGPGNRRRLGILSVADRVVHTAVKCVLEPVLEPVFQPTSFGFRPGRSVAAALEAAVDLLQHRRGRPAPFSLAVHLDVADCFPSIDHGSLLQMLAQHVADEALLALIGKLLRSSAPPDSGRWWQRPRGLVQGSALSPLLCNLYLDALDRDLAQLAQQTRRAVWALRYADDLLLLARDAAPLRLALRTVRRRLR
ncbi:MAG TPA: hypothetical protein EYP56_12185, partial [Planctomycetaceae bacterium]|nr:hypothetical protein [Planctomycetaceae bacterium]HIQ19730.1 hypothetical protein [Planctomycetota bacterium]